MSRRTVLPGTTSADGRPATLGVMGGGQLGRMFVQAAQRMGYLTAVLDPDPTSPAGLVSPYHIQADYLDEQGLAQLMQRSSAITTEFENVPAAALVTLGSQRPVAPSADAVAICQDRAMEKAHFKLSGVPCAPHAVITTAEQLQAVGEDLLPGILKTARLGYDGKGQIRVNTRSELAAAWNELQQAACVLEALLPLDREISVVLARNAQGDVVSFPVQENLHRQGILAVTQVPAPHVPEPVQQQALAAAHALAASMGYVGVLCVEFFVLKDGRLVANEMAPRPHNSGHYTVDACDVSQFDLQVRTLAGLPLVQPSLLAPAVMLNLLGDVWFDEAGAARTPPWAAVLALPGVHLHLYGKLSARRGRKMGHLTVTAATSAQAREVALQACALLGMPGF
ncbi:MAG: 5-(carboxyamino)imidazole ribonucleotide synthase [Burkholderiales bacterium]|nr:5-(carboxyamino)imidazole ribonucleotide synthase [Burkholderiales bacterium]NBO76307.1 5-(carboxyamino)imidazole ribonucleotide synthase [Betaproteobacteria bacterium]